MSGEGTGSTVGNIAIDMLTPFAIGGAKSLATNVIKRFPYRLSIPVSPDKYYRVVGMDAIENANKSGLIRWKPTPYIDGQFNTAPVKNFDPPIQSSPGLIKKGIEAFSRVLTYSKAKELPGFPGMKIIPAKIDSKIPRIMQNQVFHRLNRPIPSQEFYSNIYQTPAKLMQRYFPNSAGFNIPGKQIVIEEGGQQVKILPHELRHRLDNKYRLLDEEAEILDKAYHYLNVDDVKRAVGKDLSYNMYDEAVTTNLDSRIQLLGKYDPEYKMSLDAQNEIIDEVSNSEIIDAVERSNGYGWAYINYLKQNNLLTKDKIQAFRDAMKYVGGVSIPVTIGTSAQR